MQPNSVLFGMYRYLTHLIHQNMKMVTVEMTPNCY